MASTLREETVKYTLWPFWTDPEQLNKVTNSIALAIKGHAGQVRKYNGQPYITHPMRVAFAVASYPTAKLPWVCAAIMHDLVEDTEVTPEEIAKAAGEETMNLVLELTNTTKGLKFPRRERKRMDWERISKTSDVAKLIKMFDRIDNLKDMINAPPKFKKLYSEESLELLKVIGHVDSAIASQLQSAAEYLYIWRMFSLDELNQKPKGTVFNHSTLGDCWIGDGCFVLSDGTTRPFTDEAFMEANQTRTVLMRETGEEK